MNISENLYQPNPKVWHLRSASFECAQLQKQLDDQHLFNLYIIDNYIHGVK